MFLLADGTVRAVGRNSQGELGDATTQQKSTPVSVTGLAGVTSIDAGTQHTLAATAEGTLYTWGSGVNGKLGTGAIDFVTSPTAVATSAVGVSAGTGHSMAYTENGTVLGWGDNAQSQLGDGATTDLWVPTPITDPGFLLKVATPTFAIPGGTKDYEFNATISVLTVGAVIHYTQNGADPTEADPIVASGSSVPVVVSQTLKARAWKDGMPASNVGAVVYTLKVTTPSVSPLQGTYTSARTVTITLSTPSAERR